MRPEDTRGGETPRDLDLELQRRKVHARLFGVELPGLKLGRFTLVRRIGAGGMGVVYAARDDQLEREVALKLLHPQLGGREATTRLLREARAMARLSHPNVVQLYDVGEHAGRVFVTMEFIAGHTLRAWQAQATRGWREIVDMYIQAGKGLEAAHRAGLVHRDFKPENALVGASDGRLRVLDFGLASLVAGGSTGESSGLIPDARAQNADPTEAREAGVLPERLTVTGMNVGTPGYVAPELCGGVP
ncbi:MAG: serine/threonine-protein kinase, partial [Nannocystaceae bacterium]